MPQTHIGISGWRYTPWRGRFYPETLPQNRELHFASRCFNSIELNGSFYSLQRPGSYRRWFDETPDDFIFAIKGGRFITHMRRLVDVEQPLANFFASGLLLLKQKLGPILWQFPPNMRFDEEKFSAFFHLLPRDTATAAKLARKHGKLLTKDRRWTRTDANRPVRHAVEVRHESFVSDRFVELLRKHKIALVLADTARRFPYMEDMTADFVYARLHGDEELYVSGYTKEALDRWADRLERWRRGVEPVDANRTAKPAKRIAKGRDIYVYFDNDVKVHAPFDAMALAQRLGVNIDFDQVKRDAAFTGRRKKTEERRRPKWGR